MKKVLLLFFGILGTAFAQTTVFSDNFNTSQGSTYSTSGNIGTTNWAINRWGADFGARIDGNILEMTNDASTTTNVAGWVYVNQPFSIISTPFNSTLGSNTGLVTWTFNMRQIRADPAGFTTGSYGVAYILGSSGQTTQTGGTGYAVVLGQSGSTDPIRLVRFSAGLQTITNIITSNTSGLTDFGAEYLSVKVTYNPTTNTWALFLRSDGTSAFADPTTGTLVSQGTIVDNTYTGTSLNYFGFYWQGSTAANQTAFFDNLKIIVDAPAPPSAPTASNASDILQTSFTANWNFVSGAATYLLDVSKVNDFSTFVSGYNGKDVGNVASSNVIGLGADSTYYYRVRASNTNGTSPNSNTITINTLPNPPAAPTANEATNVTQTGMTANWGSINGATKYFLDVSIASDFSTFVTNLDNKDLGSVTSYALASLASGTTYYYRVRAYNSGGTSSNSNTMSKTLIPANPISAASTSITQTGFNANWSAVTGAALYFIDVSTEKDFSTYVTGYQNKNTGTNTISVTGLTASIKYFFRLRAQNTSGTSGNSIIDSVTTLPNPPGAPVASAGTAISSSSFTANWSDVPEATTNFITVSEDSNFASNTISNLEVGDVTSYTVSGLTPATDYYYVIKAGNAGGTSANSNVISVSTNPGVPGAPVATEAAALSNTGFTANWNAVGGVTKYFLDVSKVNDFSTFVDGFNAKDVGNITTFAVSGLSASTEYHYRVRASNVTGVSDNSNVIAVTTNPPAPNAPAAIAAAAITSSGFTAKWNISANAAKYFLDVSAQIDFSTTITGYNYVDVGNVTSVNVAGLTAGTDYYYRVYATNVTGTSAASNTITTITVPSAPAASTATNIAQTGFTANWNTVTGAAKYYLDVSTQNNFSTFILGYDSTDIGNVLTTNVTGLAANTDYHYRVRAGNASGLSVNSNVVSVTTLPNAPEAPIANSAASITTTGFTANWNTSSGATKYFLDVSTVSNFSTFVSGFQNKDVANVTSFAVTGLTAGTAYHYRLRAFNTGGTSESSNVINVTTSASTSQTLTAGDIAIIGVNTDDPDQFSFVPLVDLQTGTVIRFTDSGLKANGTFRGGEGAVKYTTPSGGMAAGTIITFTSPAAGNFASDTDAAVGTSGFNLSASGDQVTAFQGSSSSPTFIYSVTTHRNTFSADAGSSNETALPAGLTNGTTAVAVGGASSDNDNAVYNMSVTSGTRNELLAAIGNSSNWNVSNTSLTMPIGSFTIGSGSAAIPNPPVAQNAANITASGFTANWSTSSGATKYFLDAAADSSFNNKLSSFDNKDVGNSTSTAVTA